MAMRFEQSQSLKMGQHMKLAPRVIQSMEILQMPLAELEERIDQELENNITLELDEPGSDSDPADSGTDTGDGSDESPSGSDPDDVEYEALPTDFDPDTDRDDFARLDEFSNDVPEAVENTFESLPERSRERPERLTAGMAGEPEARAAAIANTPARGASLHDQLRDQWRLADVDDELLPLGETLIGFIGDDGYLRTPLEEIADRPGEAGSVDLLARALQALQLFLEPPGIGARDVRECLSLQLDALEAEGAEGFSETELHTARRLVEDHLDDLGQNRLPKIVEATGIEMDDVKRGVDVMRRLALAPARALIETRSESVTPDAVVEYDDENDRYVAFLNDRSMPQLRINRQYAMMSKDKAVEKKDRDFIKTNLSNAQWLIDALHQRQNTLLRVLRVVVDAQREYFDYGPENLKPLPMTQVADQLGIHVATVSRAVADKWILTPRGTVPLRGFFSGGLQTESGDDMSYDAIKAALKQVIDEEDKAKPLSDEALVKAMKERGIEIARRTVAKYRSQLDIPSARLRKQF